MYALEGKGYDEEEHMRNLALERMNEAANLRFSVNGKLVPLEFTNFRTKALVTHVILPIDNIFSMDVASTSIVVDGFWIFFRPLVKELTLETYGTCQSGQIQIAVTYHLTVRDL